MIIGKEKAFDIDDKELLFYESVNNVYYWKLIVDGELEKMSGNTIDEKILGFVGKYDFCPLFPLALKLYRESRYRKTFTSGHTWKKYEAIINNVYNLNLSYDTYNYEYSKSFFSKCFITELNYIPSKKTNNKSIGSLNKRVEIFSHHFFKKFKVILFTATAFIGNDYKSILDIFADINSLKVFKDANIKQTRNIRKLYHIENEGCFIFTNQLSGSRAWSNEEISYLSSLIKPFIKS